MTSPIQPTVVDAPLTEESAVRDFVDNLCVLEPGAWVSVKALHRAYCTYCEDRWLPVFLSFHFASTLLRLFEVRLEQHRKGNRLVNGISGIQLREERRS